MCAVLDVADTLAGVARRLGGARVLALPTLRLLAVVAGFTWLLLAPAEYRGATALWLAVAGFAGFSALVTAALWVAPSWTLAWSFPVLVVDLGFALLLIALTGGASSALFLALLVIAGVQAYYHGLWRGGAVAVAAGIAYLAVIWSSMTPVDAADTALRLVVLLGTALAVGLLAHVEAGERREVARLTAEAGRLERSARQAEKLASLGTLAAGLAHEMNNPIGIISSRVEIMLMDAESQPLPPGAAEDLRVIQRHAQRVAAIAQGLLSFARHSSDRRAPVDLNHLVEETMLLVEKQLVRDRIAVRRVLAADVPPVLGDANALQQVLLNLLNNARDALGGRGELSIETAAPAERPGTARLIVRDTGPGIPAEALPRIFDPFFTTKPEGTGLGLSITYGIVRDHQGRIDVETEPGRGTAFVLTFPSAARAAEA
jgi:signal transduction histidine kinase